VFLPMLDHCKQMRAQVPERADSSQQGRSVPSWNFPDDTVRPGPRVVLVHRLARFCGRLYAGGMRGRGVAALVMAAVSALVTLAVALIPQLHFAYRAPLLHVALETAASLVALLAGFLVFGRLRRACRLNEMFLAGALATLALLNLLYVMTPALVPHDLMVLAALIGSSLGAVLFALAAFAPRGELRRPGVALAGLAIAVLVTGVLVGEFTGRLPPAATGLPPEPTRRPDLYGQPAVLALQVLMALLYAIAAIGYLRRSQRIGDEFYGWIAIAAILAAASHFNYFLYPSLYGQWVHTGDIFRLSFYAVLLTGSIREIWSYWRAMSAAAVVEERRRIARDLHDGLAQELAYLARNLDSLGSLEAGAADGTLERLRRAVERARLESRRAVSTLAAPTGQSTESALAEAVAEVAERFHVGLDLDLATGLQLPVARAEALVRIACEAVTNAARHSGAGRVRLDLERDGTRARLRVSDQGRGFDPAADHGSGFGLVSMRERARSVGGELRISSAPGRGSKVEVAV
jgi:signal transduction histidine kinase